MIPLITKTCIRCNNSFEFYEVSKGATKTVKYCNKCRKEVNFENNRRYKRRIRSQ